MPRNKKTSTVPKTKGSKKRGTTKPSNQQTNLSRPMEKFLELEPNTDKTIPQTKSSPEATVTSEGKQTEGRERTIDSPETNELKPDTKIKKEDDTNDIPPHTEEPTAQEPSSSRELVAHPTSSEDLVTGPTSSGELVAHPSPSAELVAHPSPSAELVAHPSPSAELVAHRSPSRELVTGPSSSEDLSTGSGKVTTNTDTRVGKTKTVPQKVDKVEKKPRRSSRSKRPTSDRSSDGGQPRQVQQTLTDIFPVRRSTRKCKALMETEKLEDLASKIRNKREDGLEVIKDELKGRGVVSTRPCKRGDFICEYSGDLISFDEAKKREEKYSQDLDTGCYMYYFEHKNTKYCVDATEDNGRMGRLLNHSRTQANVTTKLCDVDGRPHLYLVASKDIEAGVELLYDYGERNREAIESHPWLTS